MHDWREPGVKLLGRMSGCWQDIVQVCGEEALSSDIVQLYARP